jgi:alpha-1,3-mannosyltransferase
MFSFLWLQASKRLHGKRLFLNRPLSPEYVVYTMFVSNFVGIAFARTLHYQFYCWYYQAMPFLLWYSASYPLIVRVLVVGMLEYAFNVFPATQGSSAVLQVAHMLILVGLRPPAEILRQKQKQKK